MSFDKNEFDVYSSVESFNEKASAKGLKIKVLCECGQRCLLMLYNKQLLQRLLQDASRRHLLEKWGYSRDMDTEQCLDTLAKRCSGTGGFPHEIGVFLGYPVEDVKGFILHKGCGFKLCGYWKVYGDEKQARSTFKRYDKCRRYLCNKLGEGLDLYQILRIS